jgi:hypothetical protein
MPGLLVIVPLAVLVGVALTTAYQLFESRRRLVEEDEWEITEHVVERSTLKE